MPPLATETSSPLQRLVAVAAWGGRRDPSLISTLSGPGFAPTKGRTDRASIVAQRDLLRLNLRTENP
jgi:hypothetical protein